jgi:hypothetical protein
MLGLSKKKIVLILSYCATVLAGELIGNVRCDDEYWKVGMIQIGNWVALVNLKKNVAFQSFCRKNIRHEEITMYNGTVGTCEYRRNNHWYSRRQVNYKCSEETKYWEMTSEKFFDHNGEIPIPVPRI